MITVAYTNVGRHKGCKTININISKNSQKEKKEIYIAHGAKEFLLSKEINTVEYKKNKFKIFAGVQMVGTAEII